MARKPGVGLPESLCTCHWGHHYPRLNYVEMENKSSPLPVFFPFNLPFNKASFVLFWNAICCLIKVDLINMVILQANQLF